MLNFKEAKAILMKLPLTVDDKKKFSPRGSLATQLLDSVSKVLTTVGYDFKTFGETKLLYLKIANDETSKIVANLTVAYDLHNLFLSSDKETSLHQMGVGNDGEKGLVHLASFTVDAIVPQGIYPMKFSRASEVLKISVDDDNKDIPWGELRKLYNSEPAMQKARLDMEDIAWKEIKHIHITPIGE